MERSIVIVKKILKKIKDIFCNFNRRDEQLKSESIQSLDRNDIYLHLYDKEKKQNVGKWRKAHDFIDIGGKS